MRLSMKRKVLWVSACAVIAVSAAAAGLLYGAADAKREKAPKPKDDLYAQVELFADAVSVIRSDYVDEVESQKIVYGALQGMLSSLDDYSQFLTPEDYQEIKTEVKGEFGGIGVEIGMRDGLLTVITPISGSPADKAGILAGDRVVKIEGDVTKNMTLDDAVKKLRGEAGTTVKLTVWREKENRILEMPLTRSVIKIRSVKRAEVMEEKIGYIKLVEFQEKTPHDLRAAVRKLKKDGMDALILDLRNNPGGLLTIAVAVAEEFLPKGAPIVSTKSRIKSQNLTFASKNASAAAGFPLVILMNEGSASASEIVAGAIQDNKRGIVVGAKSYGKGSVQTVMPMKDGSALRLTTASYYTPSGRSIRGSGIVPDVAVAQERIYTEPSGLRRKTDIFRKLEEKSGEEAEEEAETPEKPRDTQLDRAIDIIKGIKAYAKVT